MPTPKVPLREPLAPADATKLVRNIIVSGSTVFTKHCRDEMRADDLCEPDLLNVLRAGRIVQAAELERGNMKAPATWRYRVETDRICVVVSFRATNAVILVTTWRKKRRGAA
jgi:hypothetical protein